jgi:hypothetical protein
MSPPAEDSATATVWPRAVSRSATWAAGSVRAWESTAEP